MKDSLQNKKMNFRIFCIFMLFMINITIHSLIEKSNCEVPDFRYIKTICTNGVYDFGHIEKRICWVFHSDVRFSQPYLPYEIMVFLDIFIFIVGLFFF